MEADTSDGAGRFNIDVGGFGLTEFENLGMTENDQNIFIYKSRATFKFDVNFFTSCGIWDIFPHVDLDYLASRNYLHLKTYDAAWNRLYAPWQSFAIDYRTVSYGKINPHDYSGYVPLIININPSFGFDSSFEINGITLENTQILYHIKLVKVWDVREGEVGSYQDQYTDQNIVSGGVTTDTIGKSTPNIEMVQNWINEQDLGWSLGSREVSTIQNYAISTDAIGSTFTNLDPQVGFIFNSHIQIRPEIIQNTEEIMIRYARIEADIVDTPIFSPAGILVIESPNTQIHDRISSVTIKNRFVHEEFNVIVDFIATTEIEYELYEEALQDPFFVQGDFIWYEGISGTTDAAISFSQFDIFGLIFSFLGEIIWIIIIIVIIIALVYLSPTLIKIIVGSVKKKSKR